MTPRKPSSCDVDGLSTMWIAGPVDDRRRPPRELGSVRTCRSPPPPTRPTRSDARDVRHPFTTAQALAAGITQSQLRGPDFRRLSKGKYVSAARRPSALLEAEAALLGHPGRAVASHTTAARAFDLPVPDDPEWHVGVMHPDDRRRRSGVRSHVISPRTRVITLQGRTCWRRRWTSSSSSPTCSPSSTSSSWATAWSARSGHHPHSSWTSAPPPTRPTQVVPWRPPGSSAVGVDSPMETRLRMLLVLAGLPEPRVNYLLRDEHGIVVRRFDLYYPVRPRARGVRRKAARRGCSAVRARHLPS